MVSLEPHSRLSITTLDPPWALSNYSSGWILPNRISLINPEKPDPYLYLNEPFKSPNALIEESTDLISLSLSTTKYCDHPPFYDPSAIPAQVETILWFCSSSSVP